MSHDAPSTPPLYPQLPTRSSSHPWTHRWVWLLSSMTVAALLGASIELLMWSAHACPRHEQVTEPPLRLTSTLPHHLSLEWLAAEPTQVTRSIQLLPSYRDQRYWGMRVYGIEAHSPLAVIGLRNGDRILSINGEPFSESSSARELWAPLRLVEVGNATSVEIVRQGRELELVVCVLPDGQLAASIPKRQRGSIGSAM